LFSFGVSEPTKKDNRFLKLKAVIEGELFTVGVYPGSPAV
jgi:hypothetical protein